MNDKEFFELVKGKKIKWFSWKNTYCIPTKISENNRFISEVYDNGILRDTSTYNICNGVDENNLYEPKRDCWYLIEHDIDDKDIATNTKDILEKLGQENFKKAARRIYLISKLLKHWQDISLSIYHLNDILNSFIPEKNIKIANCRVFKNVITKLIEGGKNV